MGFNKMLNRKNVGYKCDDLILKNKKEIAQFLN